MEQAIGNKAAIKFAVALYDAPEIGQIKIIEFAYKRGCISIKMAGISEVLISVIEKSFYKIMIIFF